MKAHIHPAALKGRVEAVMPSKSQSHRALICAFLAQEPTTIHNIRFSADAERTCDCLAAMGGRFERAGNSVTVFPGRQAPDRPLDCGESGSTLRFLLPLAAALGNPVAFTGQGKLAQRPLSPLWEEMTTHGCLLSPQGRFPLTCSGKLQPGVYRIAGNVSSQFVTGLLMALPLLSGDSEVRVEGTLESRPYVEMTLETLRRFQVSVEETEAGFRIPGNQRFRTPGEITLEGDWSGAAFWLTAGALSGEGVTCAGMNLSSAQGDREIVRLLRAFGAEVAEAGDTVSVRQGAGPLRGIGIDLRSIPDLAPILAVAAACAEGETRIGPVARLRMKESDRVASVIAMIRGLGGTAEERDGDLVITGAGRLRGGQVNSFRDHRIAMAAAIAGSFAEGETEILDAEAVSKSYPGFFEVYRSLGGLAEEEE